MSVMWNSAVDMDQIHKDALRRTRVALVKDLDVNNVCDELLSQDIFTQLMMEYIMVSCDCVFTCFMSV